MHHPVTWAEIIGVLVAIWLGLYVLRFLLAVVVALIEHREDMKVDGEEGKEPYAGKTLGL